MTRPSSHNAMIEPIGRGEEPQVRTTVANSAALPCARQATNSRNTVTSIFSITTSSNFHQVNKIQHDIMVTQLLILFFSGTILNLQGYPCQK